MYASTKKSMGAGFITEMCNTLRVVHLHGFYGGMASTWTVKSLLASYLPQRLFLYCTEIKSSPAESRSIDLLNDEITDNGEFLFIDSFGKYARVLSGVNTIPVCTEGMAINLNDFRWQRHCRGLLELPMAAWISNSPWTPNY
jgi:hypothetical protein